MNVAVILFSGGQDSTTCLFHSFARYDRVLTMGFDYGQRHSVELACRAEILRRIPLEFGEYAGKLGEDRLIDIRSFGALNANALTAGQSIEIGRNGLSTTFVPGRNLLFLCYAGALAYAAEAHTIVTGVSQTDYSGYPDCREPTMAAMEKALTLGMEVPMTIETPLMHISKAETWALAERTGGRKLVDFIVERTHTCYTGERGKRHAWGYGCGECPACVLRRQGWEEYAAGACAMA